MSGNDQAVILIVDDTPDNIDVLANILRGDYTVKIALNGEKALQIADSDPAPDLILLDIMMPGIDGYEVCRRLKADVATASIPVIFISAMEGEQDQKRGYDLGAVDFITKPIDPDAVEASVRSHI